MGWTQIIDRTLERLCGQVIKAYRRKIFKTGAYFWPIVRKP
jgi:hypothetical protein